MLSQAQTGDPFAQVTFVLLCQRCELVLLLCIILKYNIVCRYSNWIGVLVWEFQYIVVSDIFTATLGFFSTIICLFFSLWSYINHQISIFIIFKCDDVILFSCIYLTLARTISK